MTIHTKIKTKEELGEMYDNGIIVHYQGEDGKVYCGIKGSHRYSWEFQNVNCKRCIARRVSGRNP